MPKKTGNPRGFENEELERATIQKYRRLRINKRVDRCMVIYRLNAWKTKRGADTPPQDPDTPLLEDYQGRMDFNVNYYEDYKKHSCHILSKPRPARKSVLMPTGPRPERIICDHKKVSIDHCYIYPLKADKERTWIEDKTSKTGTFVNGKRLRQGKKFPLRDGDIIALGSPHHSEGHWKGPKKEREFVFKVKCFKRRDEEDNQVNREPEDVTSPVFLALNNNVVVGEILNFLSHKDLKTARLINNFWKGMADNKICSRSVQQLRNSDYRVSYSMTESYNFPNWRIDFKCKEKLPNEIVNLMKNKGHLVQTLQLKMTYKSENFGDQFTSILRHLPNLESLQLELGVHSVAEDNLKLRTDPISIIKAEDTTFPSMKYLCLDVGYFGFNLLTMTDMLAQAAKLFPNIQKITTKNKLKDLLLPISTHNLWAAGLKGIGGCIYGWKSRNSQHVYDTLHALNHKLRKLELHDIPPLKNPVEITSFENMLKRHAPTLEHLVLRFKVEYKWGSSKKDEEIKPILKFPTFPKLKSLEFMSSQENALDFQILFPSSSSGSICYEQDFPLIKELRLLPIRSYQFNHWHPSNMRDYQHFYGSYNTKAILDIFIPKDSPTVSRTMTWVEFGLGDEVRKNGNPKYLEFVERFRRMFPYVHHPHLKEKPGMEDSEESEDSSEEGPGPKDSEDEDSESEEYSDDEEYEDPESESECSDEDMEKSECSDDDDDDSESSEED